jgi:hypothetical protein
MIRELSWPLLFIRDFVYMTLDFTMIRHACSVSQ